MAERIDVVGVSAGGELSGASAREAIDGAALVVGGRRHLQAIGPIAPRHVEMTGDLGGAGDLIAAEPGPVCVLASGDPGFFGVVRPLSDRFGPEVVRVHPVPSAVSLAFARLGLSWDDAVVVSAHGRSLDDAARLVARSSKVAVLVSPEASPQRLGQALLALGAPHTTAAVCARLGSADEEITTVDLPGLAAGSWDPLSVVVLTVGSGVSPVKSLAWGLPEAAFSHRRGMITKSEVRAATLGRLALPGPAPAGAATPVLWDLGAGSGSVGIECARLAPWLEVVAVECDGVAIDGIRANATRHGVAIRIVHGRAPEILATLPDPDRVFVGGGGLDVLDKALLRLRPGGVIVATFAAIDRAAAAADRLGSLSQISVSRGVRLPDRGWRLEAGNPVFLAWGPGGGRPEVDDLVDDEIGGVREPTEGPQPSGLIGTPR